MHVDAVSDLVRAIAMQVDQEILELTLEKIHDQNRIWNQQIVHGRQADLEARQKVKHYDTKFWEHEHNRKQALRAFKDLQTDRKVAIAKSGVKIEMYLWLRR